MTTIRKRGSWPAEYADDGSVEVVIAHRDPGPAFPNWLETCGHDQGGMIGRYIGAENPPALLEARVVRFDDLTKD